MARVVGTHELRRPAVLALQTLADPAGLTSLSVLQAPTLPYQPARPHKLLLLLLALFAGIAGGLALCLFLESMDDTLALPEQVETAIGLPLLAVVNHHSLDGHR